MNILWLLYKKKLKYRRVFIAATAAERSKPMKTRPVRTKLLTALLTLCMVLTLMPMAAFAESGAYAVKFYPGDHGTMTKNDQIPFVYYNIDDDVNKPFYYKLHVSETDTFGFVGSIMDTLLPNSGYEFAYWTADATVYQVGSGTAIPADTALSSDQLQNKITVKSDVTFTAHFKQISEYPDDSVITTATIENVKFDYQLGDAPQATAWVAIDDMDKYEIDYECWQQFKGNEPVAAWYSDNGSHGSLPTITKFESGKKYVYSLMLNPKDGYSFSSETVITVNGEKVAAPFVGGSMYIPAIKTITMPTVTVIDVVEINDVTVSFKDGDKPVFTGKVPDGANYAYRCEWWELDSKTGAMSTDFGNFYENKITAFEAGKTYHYGVYVTTYGDVGNVSYVFGPDTKLKINGEFVNYTRYEGDESDGSDGTMWVLTDLTMTPEAGAVTPSDKYTVTYTDGVEGEEIFKDQTYTVESGKATPAFNGTPVRKGYTFTGWKPAVAAKVTDNATYEATWKSNTATNTTTPSENKPDTGETTDPKTGDTSNMTLWIALLFVSGSAVIGTIAVKRKKKYNR